MIVPMSRPAAAAPLVRSADPDDRPAIAAILASNDEPVDWPGLPGWPYLDHLIEHGRTVVAESDGVVAGFAAAVDVGATSHVSDLFVAPGLHGRGLGRALLTRLRDGAEDRPWTTFSSADPKALSLYVRAGMRPWWPNLYLVRVADARPIPDDLGAHRVAPLDAHAAELAMTGIDRSAEYRHWNRLPGATGVIVDGPSGRPIAAGVGTAMRRADGAWLKHLAIDSVVEDGVAAAAVLAALTALPEGHHLGLCIPGPHPAVPTLLAAGYRIFDRDTYCATDPTLLDPTRAVPDASFL
jgi:GNAT superfamily N-acetyltransferase